METYTPEKENEDPKNSTVGEKNSDFIIIYSLALSQINQNLLKRVKQQIDAGYQNIDRLHVERTYHHNAYII